MTDNTALTPTVGFPQWAPSLPEALASIGFPDVMDGWIQSDDVRDRLNELNDLLDAIANPDPDDDTPYTPEDMDADERAELVILRAFAAAVNDAGDLDMHADNGDSLIRADEFEGYARELAEDCGTPPPGPDHRGRVTWPYRHIDWKAAAEELADDYYEVEFDGVTWLAFNWNNPSRA